MTALNEATRGTRIAMYSERLGAMALESEAERDKYAAALGVAKRELEEIYDIMARGSHARRRFMIRINKIIRNIDRALE